MITVVKILFLALYIVLIFSFYFLCFYTHAEGK